MTGRPSSLIEFVTSQRLVRLEDARVARRPSLTARRARSDPQPRAPARRGPLRHRHARDVPAASRRRPSFDALAETAQPRDLLRADARGETVQGAATESVEFAVDVLAASAREPRRRARRGRSSRTRRSSSTRQLILKVFRRLEAGINPELELLRFLTEHEFENIAQLAGWYAYAGHQMDATLGILQAYVAGGEDGWERSLATMGEEPERFLDSLHTLGEVTGRMHSVLGSDSTTRLSRRRRPPPSRSGCSRRRWTRRSSRSSWTCRSTTTTSSRSADAARRCASGCAC